jgi:hypothetical protein
MSRFNEVKDLINSLEGDFDWFYERRNQDAGTRLTKGMQELKTLAEEIIINVQRIRN